MKKFLKCFDLSKKNIIVLGSEGLIGREIIKSCVETNAKIICLDLKFENLQKNNNVYFEKFDVTKLNKIDSFLKKIVKKYGPPNCFINASYPKSKNWVKNSYKDVDLNDYIKNVNLHMNTYIWIAKKIADIMVTNNIKDGSIVQLSSIYGILGQDSELYKNTEMRESMTYSAIKGGINNSVRSMAAYYGKYNLRINSIIAGGVFDYQSKNFVKKYKRKTPLGRMANPKEIAFSSLFLISDASSYITGSSLVVDGGYSIL